MLLVAGLPGGVLQIEAVPAGALVQVVLERPVGAGGAVGPGAGGDGAGGCGALGVGGGGGPEQSGAEHGGGGTDEQ